MLFCLTFFKRLPYKIDSVEKGLNNKIDSVEKGLKEEIKTVEKGLSNKIDSVKEDLKNTENTLMIVLRAIDQDIRELKDDINIIEEQTDLNSRKIMKLKYKEA